MTQPAAANELATATPPPATVWLNGRRFARRIDAATLRQRIAALAHQVWAHLPAGQGQPAPVLMPVLNGALPFAAALMAHWAHPWLLAPVKVASYGQGMEASTPPRLELPPHVPLAGRQVLLIEDIVDTGATVDFLHRELLNRGASGITVCTLLYKPGRYRGLLPPPAFVGFAIEDAFVVGFGLDYAEEGRWLPAIYQLADQPEP